MKRALVLVSIATIVFILSTTPVHANISSFQDVAPALVQDIGLNPNLTSIDGIINTLVPILLTFAGLILFLMLLSGGFTILTSANNPEGAQKGKARITMAITGFIIIFSAYWIVEFLEIILGLTIF